MTITTLSAIQVKKLAVSTSATAVIKAALLVKTAGDPDVTAPPVSDVTIHASANLLQNMETGSKASPPTYTTGQVSGQKHIVITQYNEIVGNVQTVAIRVANAHSDASFGNTVATRCGFKLSKAKTPGKQPDFGFTASGPGWKQVHAKKAKKGNEGHVFRAALTSADGTSPNKADIIYFFTLECDIIIKDIPKGKILAVDHASVLPGSHSKTTGTTGMATGKAASTISVSKGNHPTFSLLTADPYTWKGWIYE